MSADAGRRLSAMVSRRKAMLEPDEVAVLRQARQEPRAWQPKTERWPRRPAPLRDCS